MTMRPTSILALLAIAGGLLAALPAPARAGELESETETPIAPPPDVRMAARDGAFLPSVLAPQVGTVSALAFGFAGYDGARAAPIGSATAEVRIWGPIALRGGAEYSTVRKEPRPTVGARVQLLRQGRHGVDGALGVFYRPEGFTEPEGELETFVSVGHRFDRLAVLANLVYGQDPEGNERDGEIRLASIYAAGRWMFGFDSRLRFAIGAQRGAMAAAEPKFDLVAGPVASAAVGPVALFAEAGPSVLSVAGATSAGMAALAGVGSTF
jgi:hypothetical protein